MAMINKCTIHCAELEHSICGLCWCATRARHAASALCFYTVPSSCLAGGTTVFQVQDHSPNRAGKEGPSAQAMRDRSQSITAATGQ
eukprot:1158356-Pelagomonas_calceolata.AAC.5